MPTSSELIGLGMPPALANALGVEVTTGVTAAGTTLATATSLVAPIATVTTATVNQGVVLPQASGRPDYMVVNATSVTIKVYPASGDTINGATASSPLMLPATKTALLKSYGTGWGAVVGA